MKLFSPTCCLSAPCHAAAWIAINDFLMTIGRTYFLNAEFHAVLPEDKKSLASLFLAAMEDEGFLRKTRIEFPERDCSVHVWELV